MIPVPSGVRVWLAVGRTDMRRGMNGLSLQVQETLGRDPFAGDLFVFRGKRGDQIKVLWHDGLGLSLYAKRLERGRFVWPTASGGSVAISSGRSGGGESIHEENHRPPPAARRKCTRTGLSRTLRPVCVNRVTPVDPVEHIGEL